MVDIEEKRLVFVDELCDALDCTPSAYAFCLLFAKRFCLEAWFLLV